MSRNGILLLSSWVLIGMTLVHAPPALTGVLTFLFVMVGWIVALAVHEFSHAWVAWKAGDHTVEAAGYLGFDPLKYADVATSIVFPVIVLAIGGIALPGGAVYLRPDLMRSAAWRSAASLAGPVGTLLVLIVLAILLSFGPATGWGGALWPALALLALFQAMAFFFNLLPVPGLDGYGVIRPFLPPQLQARLAPVEKIAIFVLIAVVLFVPGASEALFGSAVFLTSLLGIDTRQIGEGYVNFHFWQAGGG
jgi:Zn-dependent protease